jgi:hypothetical protein
MVLQLGGWAWGYHLPTIKNKLVTKDHKKRRTWMDLFDKRPKLKKMDMRFGIWNVRSSYRVGSLRTGAEEISNIRFNRSTGGQMGQR